MSTTTDAPAGDTTGTHEAEGHAHPSDWKYIQIAIWLAIFTAIEVGTYFESWHGASHTVMYIVLIVLMVVKFALVGAFFMHLKFDSPLFRWMFYSGIGLALGVYLVMLATFRYWD